MTEGTTLSQVEATAAAAAMDTSTFNVTRDLAGAINEAAASAGGSIDVIKGVVVSVETSTFTATLNGDTVPVAEIRYLDSYSPVVGDVVAILKLTSNIFCLGQYNNSTANGATANGWVTVTLGSGFTHVAGNNVKYRVVIDNGDKKVQLRGACTVSGSPTALWTMPVGVRPSAYQSVIISRDVAGGSNTAVLGINTNGTMFLDGTTTGVRSVGSTTGADGGFSGSVGTSGVGFNHGHKFLNLDWGTTDEYRNADWGVKDFVTGNHSHGITVGDHTHSVSWNAVLFPDSLSFAGVEYFL